MMTEEEAKEKWCPHYRSMVAITSMGDSREFDTNRASSEFSDVDRPTCIASQCMAWRWNEAKRTQAFIKAVQDRMEKYEPKKPYSRNRAIAEVYAEIGSDLKYTEGYCGLAGKPE